MMQKKYSRLSFNKRIEIEKLLSHKKSYADIATVLGRSKSTIQRDVKKQGTQHYKAMQSEWLAVCNSSNRKSGKNKLKQCEALENYVLRKLSLRWSPRQISISLQENFRKIKLYNSLTKPSIYTSICTVKKSSKAC